MAGDASQEIEKYRTKIDHALHTFFNQDLSRLHSISPFVQEILTVISEFTLRGGKRIRPILIILGYKAAGGTKEDAIIKASISIELLHSYFLIHDDIIDRDDLRRGAPAVHSLYERLFRRKCDDPHHLAISLAIIAGDLLSHIGADILLSSPFPSRQRAEAASIFHRVAINTGFGELIDVRSSVSPTFSDENVVTIHTLKTAKYTIEGPLHIGAALAGGDRRIMQTFSRYAIPLGRAFQIRDDILGMFGTRDKIGKPVTSDIEEGKETLLISKAYHAASPAERRFLQETIGKKGVSISELNRVKKIVKETGAYHHSQKESEKLADQARTAIRKSSLSPAYKEILLGFADYVIRREN